MTDLHPPATPAEALADVLRILKLEARDAPGRGRTRRFAGGSTRRSLPFVFGGQLVAQALRAAYETVPSPMRVHSLHAHFLEAGDPAAPLFYDVEVVRERGSVHMRRVSARQLRPPHANGSSTDGPAGLEEVVVLEASVSFTLDRPGLEHSRPPRPEAPTNPEILPSLGQWLDPHRDALPDWWTGPMPVDLRYAAEPPHVLAPGTAPRLDQHLWMKAAGRLPHDGRLHDCMLAFASDLTLLDAVLIAHARSWYDGQLRAASMDHSIWFHRRLKLDDWVLYEQRSPAAYGGRGLALGDIYNGDGLLCATAAQQGFVSLLT